MHLQRVLHRGGTAKIEREGDFVLIRQRDGQFFLFDDATVQVSPADLELALAGGERIDPIRRSDHSIAFERC